MITIAGKPLDTANLHYPADGAEQLVINTMSKSGHEYAYDELESLKFELELRKETVNAAMALHESGMAFATFHDSTCNPEFWDRTKNGGFQLREGVSAGDAIEDIYKHGDKYGTECATAMLMVYYKALLAVYGKERFDRTFPSIYLMDWSIRQPLLAEVGTPREVNDILIGDRAYFINEDVDPEVPWWRGENVIVLPGGMYYGHGVGLLDADEIIGHLNANRKKNSDSEAHLLDQVSRPDYNKLYEAQAAPARSSQPLVWRLPPSPRDLLGLGRA